MAVSLNSVVGFNSTGKTHTSIGASLPKANHFASQLRTVEFNRSINCQNRKLVISVANNDRVVADSKESETPLSESTSSVPNETPIETPGPTSIKQKSPIKRSSLTARERLRAARTLNRSAELKKSKPDLGKKVLDALRESDGGKRSGLPEAPTNLFDDSKRGMPKPGLTFEFPGGVDVFLVVFSVVFISTVMFTTTYIVWKVGAIHFNEY